MIGLIEGPIEVKTDKYLIIKTGGVGYKVFCTQATIEQTGKESEKAKLFTHLYVRENLMDLYGFNSLEELDFFQNLISVSGIGPKAALLVMALAPVKTLKEAIASGQKTLLTKVAGIGSKTAERIILELGNKIFAPARDVQSLSADSEAIDALVGLGYTSSQARGALEQIPKETEGIENKVKEALKVLGKK